MPKGKNEMPKGKKILSEICHNDEIIFKSDGLLFLWDSDKLCDRKRLISGLRPLG
jgi:hypothetical protein